MLGLNDSLLKSSMGFLKTLFLFTKSDLKTILIPVTVFAASTAPLQDPAYLPQLMLWIWLHLLQFDLANQILGPDEDALNKPDRPIPSGRINVQQTRMLRWACLIPCLGLSAWYSHAVVLASVSLIFLSFIYNELGWDSHWLSRNVLNGAGLAFFEIGATLIANHDRTRLDFTSKLATVVSAAIYTTTNYAQDFKDVSGDQKVGRRTLPMIFPVASRIFIFIFLVVWSLGLVHLWETGPFVSAMLLALASLVGTRFIFLKSVLEDQKSYYMYNVWYSLVHALPALPTTP